MGRWSVCVLGPVPRKVPREEFLGKGAALLLDTLAPSVVYDCE